MLTLTLQLIALLWIFQLSLRGIFALRTYFKRKKLLDGLYAEHKVILTEEKNGTYTPTL